MTAMSGLRAYERNENEPELNPREYFPDLPFDEIESMLQSGQEVVLDFAAEKVGTLAANVAEYTLRKEVDPSLTGTFVETVSSSATNTSDGAIEVSFRTKVGSKTEEAAAASLDLFYAGIDTGERYTTSVHIGAAPDTAHAAGRLKRMIPEVSIYSSVSPDSEHADSKTYKGRFDEIDPAATLARSTRRLDDNLTRIIQEALSDDNTSIQAIWSGNHSPKVFLGINNNELQATVTTPGIMAEKTKAEKQLYEFDITPEEAANLSDNVKAVTRFIAPQAREELGLPMLLSANYLENAYKKGNAAMTRMEVEEGTETTPDLSLDGNVNANSNLRFIVTKDVYDEIASSKFECFIDTNGQLEPWNIYDEESQAAATLNRQERTQIIQILFGNMPVHLNHSSGDDFTSTVLIIDDQEVYYSVDSHGRVFVSAKKVTRY